MFGVSRRRVRIVKRRRSRRPKPWSADVQKEYAEHKEAARALCHERLDHYNQHYQLKFNRVAIRNTRSRWGSCSSKKNLNFNYRILFLEPELQDYLIVHELCHLQEMNHAPQFWALVAEQIPDYKACVLGLRAAEKTLLKP
jgi:predicted metal-dependent hydrolase